MTTTTLTDIPSAWNPVPDGIVEAAKHATLNALSNDGPSPVGENLANYYAVDGGFIGATFAAMESEPDNITAADLLAVNLMRGRVGPRASRRLLRDTEYRRTVLDLLRQLPQVGLAHVDADGLEAMLAFYTAVKDSFKQPGKPSSNPWVTASKLTARKRPALFPVRDSVVCKLLGLYKLADMRIDWLVFRELMRDDEVLAALDRAPAAAREAAGEQELELDREPLRILDAALWMYRS